MPARNPRINVVLEPPLYDAVGRLARRDNVSLSTKMRDLVKDALEVQEDAALARLAEERESSFSRRKALTHTEVWKKRSRR